MAPRRKKTEEKTELEDKPEVKPESIKKVETTTKPEPVKEPVQEKKPEPVKTTTSEKKSVNQEKKSEVIPTKEKNTKNDSKYVFNLSDGVTWHDFVGLLLIVFRIIWRIVKVVFWPVFWVWAQNVKIKRFITAKTEDRLMTEDERLLFESSPTIFVATGITGGVILGILIAFKIDPFKSFDYIIEQFNKNFLGWLVTGIYDWTKIILLTLIGWLLQVIDSIKNIYSKDPYSAFFVLVLGGILLTLVWITFQEKVGDKIKAIIIKWFNLIFGSPQQVYLKVLSSYRTFNRRLTEILIGKNRMETRTQPYFKNTLLFTSIVAIWTFFAGIYVTIDRANSLSARSAQVDANVIVFVAVVLLVAGLISGILIFALIARYFDLMNRKKYIASKFIEEPRD